MLKPNAAVPDRRKVAGPLLIKISDMENVKGNGVISSMHATIAIDGWSTMKNQPVIGVCIYVSCKCYLIGTIGTTGNPHTTEFLVGLLKLQIEQTEKTGMWN